MNNAASVYTLRMNKVKISYNKKNWPLLSLVTITSLSIMGSLFMLFSVSCGNIYGDGYPMGIDPGPIVIGRECGAPLIDHLSKTPYEYISLFVVFIVQLLLILLAQLFNTKLLSIPTTKRTLLTSTIISVVFSILTATLFLLFIFLLARS